MFKINNIGDYYHVFPMYFMTIMFVAPKTYPRYIIVTEHLYLY